MNRAYVRLTLALVLTTVFGAACHPFEDNSPTHRGHRDIDAGIDAGEADEVDADAATGAGRAGSSVSTSTTSRNSGATGSAASGGSSSASGSGAMGDGSLACPDSAPSDAKVMTGDTGTVTWSGAIRITDTFTVSGTGAKLTIAPGTQVFLDAESFIEVGWNGQAVSIDAQGTASAPIRFCRSKKTGGNWKGIRIGPGVLTSSVLKYVAIEGAGQGADALVLNAGILVDHVWVRDSASNGVNAANFRDDSTNLTVTTSAAAPLVLTNPLAVHHLPLGGTFTGNKEDVVHVTEPDINVETHYREIGIPYQLDEGMSLNNGGKLTVDPGVEWLIGIDQLVELGWNGSKVEIHFDGTQAKPIVIRGADVRAGSWKGLIVRGGVYATSSLKFVQFLHGGGFDGSALTLLSPITASDIVFKDNAHEAFVIGDQGLAPASARFTVTNTKGTAGRVAANSITSVPAGGSFIGNQNDYIEVDGGNLLRSGTVPEVDVPFHVLERIDVYQGAALTISPGAKFQMQNGVAWNFGWNGQKATIIAAGTAAKPIEFRGMLDQAGFWDGILIGGNVTSNSKLDFVQIGHGGGGSTAGANLKLNAPIAVTNSKFYSSSTYGIVAPMTFMQDYEGLNTFDSNSMGTVQRD